MLWQNDFQTVIGLNKYVNSEIMPGDQLVANDYSIALEL